MKPNMANGRKGSIEDDDEDDDEGEDEEEVSDTVGFCLDEDFEVSVGSTGSDAMVLGFEVDGSSKEAIDRRLCGMGGNRLSGIAIPVFGK